MKVLSIEEKELNKIERKHTEWSEADEYHKRQILRILKDNGCSQTLQEKTEKWIEGRLKSIKPQKQWRPSDEQIKTLGKWLDDTRYKGDCRYVWPIFDSLYEQLKKLREE